MTQDYHEWLKSILREFEIEHKDKLTRQHSIKLTSNKRHSNSLIEYEPDYCFSFKTGKEVSSFISPLNKSRFD